MKNRSSNSPQQGNEADWLRGLGSSLARIRMAPMQASDSQERKHLRSRLIRFLTTHKTGRRGE
jgi:hypothetical protein